MVRKVEQRLPIYQQNKCMYQDENCVPSFTLSLEYRLCSQLLKKINMKSQEVELSLISQSNDLLAKISKSSEETASLEKTQETRGIYSSHEDVNLLTSRTFFRKNQTRSKIRDGSSHLADALKDVKENCLPATFQTLSKVLKQLQGRQSRLADFEKKQQEISLRERQHNQKKVEWERKDEQLIICENRIQQLQRHLAKAERQCVNSKIKYKEFQHNLFSRLNINSPPVLKAFSNAQTLDASGEIYATEKRRFMETKIKQVKAIEDGIEERIFGVLNSLKKCQNCCSIFRKIKPLIFDYKLYLEKQENAIDELFVKSTKMTLLRPQ